MDYIFDDPQIGLGFSAAALMYGGLHVLAWNAHFDSYIQQLLWRISASVVAGGLPVIFVAAILADKLDVESSTLQLADVIFLTFVFVGFLLLLAYTLARGYLVVECFINLAHLPAGVYDVPQWAAYFPHIG